MTGNLPHVGGGPFLIRDRRHSSSNTQRAQHAEPNDMASTDDTRQPSPPATGTGGVRVAGRQGLCLKRGLYLVPTSKVDGRKRWETVIRLLSQKAQDREVDELLAMLGITRERGDR
jgi:hypothetical protein